MIDISGLSKAKVLAALYNNSRAQGLGVFQASSAKMTEQEAAKYSTVGYFDYLKGRVMKVDLSGDSFEEYLYDRDNGSGAASRAVDSVR